MRTVRRVGLLIAAGLATLVPVGAADAASIWTPVSTGTADTITAISWPSTNEIVFATSNGHIYHGSTGSFAPSTLATANPFAFNDVAMSADGTKGVAVGATGKIYRSTDSGATWSAVTTTQEYTSGGCSSGFTGLGTLTDDLYSAKWADAATVYVTGAGNDVLKSTDGGASFIEVNKTAAGCRADSGGAFTDTSWLDASTGYLLSNDFGQLFVTTTGLSTSAPKKNASGEGVNGYQGIDRLAIDPANPNRMWATNPGSGGSYFQTSANGGANWTSPKYDGSNVSLQGVRFAGGTVVAVGKAGDILTSADGTNFNRQIAGGTDATNDWYAVAVLDGTHALVGGANGQLLSTSQANAVPDTVPPTGSVSGPSSLTVGQYGTYTVSATDNPGGSGLDPASYTWSATGVSGTQTGTTAKFAFSTTGIHTITVSFKDLAGNVASATKEVSVGPAVVAIPPPSGASPSVTSTGGGTVVLYKIVTVTGRKGRFIPITLSAKAGRRFVISIYPRTKKKHPKKVAGATVTLKKKGTRTFNIPLSSKVKTGKYTVVVRIYTLTGRAIGKTVQVAFILK